MTATFDLDIITEKAIRHQQAPYAAVLRAAGADIAGTCGSSVVTRPRS